MAKWMYNKNGAKLFKDGEEVPKDYVDCPNKVKEGDDMVEKKEACKGTKKGGKKGK